MSDCAALRLPLAVLCWCSWGDALHLTTAQRQAQPCGASWPQPPGVPVIPGPRWPSIQDVPWVPPHVSGPDHRLPPLPAPPVPVGAQKSVQGKYPGRRSEGRLLHLPPIHVSFELDLSVREPRADLGNNRLTTQHLQETRTLDPIRGTALSSGPALMDGVSQKQSGQEHAAACGRGPASDWGPRSGTMGSCVHFQEFT